ncbi:phosphatase PAP2 family protein [Bacteroidales bacterium OttesenSCG-928-M11]|nr:phosphatase PAP2 family protein [Bacteroidales bacterium OttesenSCG-928-M11]
MTKQIFALLLVFFYLVSVSFASEESQDSTVYTPIPLVEYKTDWKNYVVPVALITTGAIFSQTDNRDIFDFNRSDRNPHRTYFDDFMGAAIGPSVFLFDLVGEEKHHPVDQVFLLGGSYVLSLGPALLLKYCFPASRPQGDGKYSFPSGHTTAAFAGAQVIYKEFKDSNSWIAYSGYIMATAVGAARMINNKHWLCDVLAGAGLGILGAELAYWIYFPIRNWVVEKINLKNNTQAFLAPSFTSESIGLSLSLKF